MYFCHPLSSSPPLQFPEYIAGEHNILSKTLGKTLLIEPRNSYAVLTGGLPGTIQFYNVNTDQRISEIEIAHQNVVSRTDDEKQVFTLVEFVAFSSDGEWMATVRKNFFFFFFLLLLLILDCCVARLTHSVG